MRAAEEVLRRSLWKAWDGFWVVLLAEIGWLLLSLPVVTAPLGVAGLYYCMDQLAYGESVDWKAFFRGARKYAWAGYRWFGVNLLVTGVLGFYLWFFSKASASWGPIVNGLVVGLLILWWAVQAFTFPLMLSQTEPSYRTALRNSLVMYLKWPGYSLALVFFNAVVIALSVWVRFPWAFFTFSLTALIASEAVREKTSLSLPPDETLGQ